jgi:DNA gyrase subunit A
MGRGAAGVRGIALREGDYVVEMDVLPGASTADALTVTDRGFGKRTPIGEYRLQSRGGTGVINIRTTEKNGMVAGIALVQEEDQLLLITTQGKMIRVRCAGIRSTGRAAQGVRLMHLEEGDTVSAAVKIEEGAQGEFEDVETAEAEELTDSEDLVGADDESLEEETPEEPDDDDETVH